MLPCRTCTIGTPPPTIRARMSAAALLLCKDARPCKLPSTRVTMAVPRVGPDYPARGNPPGLRSIHSPMPLSSVPSVVAGGAGLSAENVHALEGLACRKRVTPASSPRRLQAGYGARVHRKPTKRGRFAQYFWGNHVCPARVQLQSCSFQWFTGTSFPNHVQCSFHFMHLYTVQRNRKYLSMYWYNQYGLREREWR
jgi:hypothetical protein